MDIMIFTSSPNANGLTASCAKKARIGTEKAGANVQMINLNEKNIRHCQACEQGWGICRTENRCIIEDDDFNVIDRHGFSIRGLRQSIPGEQGQQRHQDQ